MSVQQSTLLNRRRIRRTFGNINEVAQMPNLIEVQRNSYEQFLQMYDSVDERINVGLQAVFSSVFPIKDFVGRSMPSVKSLINAASVVCLILFYNLEIL